MTRILVLAIIFFLFFINESLFAYVLVILLVVTSVSAQPFVVPTKDGLEAIALPHRVTGARVSGTGTLKDLGVRVVVVPFASRPDVVDGIFVALCSVPPPKIVTPVMASVVTIIATVAVVVPAAEVVEASVITVLITPSVVPAIIVATGGVVRARESSGAFLQL